jgi:hypothetical protein
MITFLKILFGALFVYMIYVVVTTQSQSPLFAEWDHLMQIPWMTATIKDFYTNVIAIFCWIAYKERNIAVKLLWLVLLVCLGSIATTLYILIQLFKLKRGDSIDRLFLRT